MAIRDITQYIEANQSRFPREVLLANLRSSGYPEAEIQEALQVLKPKEGSMAAAVKERKTLTRSKVLDFVIGFFGSGLGLLLVRTLGLFSTLYYLVRGFGFGVSTAFTLQIIFYFIVPIVLFFLFRRRYRYVAFGFLASLVISLVLGMMVVPYLSFMGSSW